MLTVMPAAAEKFRRWLKEHHVEHESAFTRDAVGDVNLAWNILNKPDYRPRADKALRLARAMGTTMDWLWDEGRDWPPDSPPICGRLHAEDVDPRLLAIDQEVRRLVGMTAEEMLTVLELAWAQSRATRRAGGTASGRTEAIRQAVDRTRKRSAAPRKAQ